MPDPQKRYGGFRQRAPTAGCRATHARALSASFAQDAETAKADEKAAQLADAVDNVAQIDVVALAFGEPVAPDAVAKPEIVQNFENSAFDPVAMVADMGADDLIALQDAINVRLASLAESDAKHKTA